MNQLQIRKESHFDANSKTKQYPFCYPQEDMYTKSMRNNYQQHENENKSFLTETVTPTKSKYI